jgi:CheY-like chemotaxis protein
MMQVIRQEKHDSLGVDELAVSSETLESPANTQSPANTEQNSGKGQQAEAATQQRVLVADDNKDSRDSLATLLREYGCIVHVAHDGQSALEIVEAFKPTVILVDILMPGVNGYKVAEHLRGDPNHEGVLLIAISGWAEEETHWRSKHAGFDYHLVKPIDVTALETLLSTKR